jgi:hypothetical protein
MLLCAALAMLQCTQSQLLKLSFDDMLPYSKRVGRSVKVRLRARDACG